MGEAGVLCAACGLVTPAVPSHEPLLDSDFPKIITHSPCPSPVSNLQFPGWGLRGFMRAHPQT